MGGWASEPPYGRSVVGCGEDLFVVVVVSFCVSFSPFLGVLVKKSSVLHTAQSVSTLTAISASLWVPRVGDHHTRGAGLFDGAGPATRVSFGTNRGSTTTTAEVIEPKWVGRSETWRN